MSSQGSDIQDALPVFKPPVRVSPAATDRVTQQIQSKLGDYRYVKHFLDDPNSSIGVYGEPASPAPGIPQRGVEFKKPPNHASTPNGRPHHRAVHYFGKTPDGIMPGVHARPAPSHFPHNGKTPPNMGEPNGIPPIENILKEMKSVTMTPLTAIAATPRKETETKFNFNMASIQKINNDSLSQSHGPSEAKSAPPPKQHLDRHNKPRLSADLERDLLLTDSEDEARKRKTSSVMASPPPAGSTSGSESSSSDSDSDSSSDDSKPTVAGGAEEPPQVVEGPGEAVCSQRPSWSLSNFAPQPPESRQQPPDRQQQQQQPAAAESDSCYDSTKEVESVLAAAKGKTETLLSGLSDSEDSSDDRRAKDMRNLIRSSSAVGSSSERSRVSRGRPPRTPARPPPPSSPSEDDSPPPRPEQRKQRGRPRKMSSKSRPEEDVIKKRRGRPPKVKLLPAPPRPPSSSSDDERPPSSPAAPVRHWQTSDSEGEECSTVTTDKKKNDTLRKLFCAVGGAKGGGKGGAKGGKGKGQVVVIEAHSLEHEKEDDSLQRRLKEEEAYRRLREEEAQRRLKEEEAARRKQEEEATQRRLKEEATQKRKEEEALQRRLKDEEMRRKLKEEEAIQRKIKEDEASQRRKEEEAQRRLKEEEAQRREEAIQRRIRENDIAQRRIKEEELSQRKIKEEELSNRRFKEEDALQRRIKEEAIKPKEEDVLQRRIREDGARIRKSGADEAGGGEEAATGGSLMVRVELGRLSSSCMARIRRGKRPPPLPPAPPDKKPKLTARQNPETTPTNHERAESESARPGSQSFVYYSYLESGHQDCSSDEESRDHTYYLQEATRLRALAEQECDLLGRVMLYQESVLCFVLTGRVLELELDTKKAFTMYRETMEYIKSIQSMPARHRASPQSTLSKLDILSMRCQALLYLRMFKMYKGEVKEYYKIFQEYLQKPACPEAVGTVSPLSPTPSPAGSVGSVGSAGSSGYGSTAPALTPQHLGSTSSAPSAPSSAAPPVMLAVPQAAHQAMMCLTKYYSFLHFSYDMWEQADNLIRMHRYTELFVRVDRACGPLTLHSSFRHLVKYVRYAISILKTQSHRGS